MGRFVTVSPSINVQTYLLKHGDWSDSDVNTCLLRDSIVPMLAVVMLPHSALNFVITTANVCELAGTDDILIIAL